MRKTGIIRNLDSLGRVVLPKELRNTLGLTIGTPVEIFTDEKGVIIKKFVTKCEFCEEEEMENLVGFRGKKICKECISNLKNR